jgi:ectoine hydroxylase-related dioxygenase (phytanoyl-CoA dioxygenase family)
MDFEWKRIYDRDGFVKMDGLVSAADLDEINRELDRYIREVAPTLPANDIVWEKEPLPDGTRGIRNLWRMADHSPFFHRFATSQRLMALAEAMFNGKTPTMVQVETFSKPARVGSAVPHHQDNAYFCLTPPDCYTLWIALDASTVENGCVWFARGSHRAAISHGASGVTGNSMMAIDGLVGLDEVPAILAPGDATAHHCMTIHRSEPNRSEHPRRGLVIVYKASDCRLDPEAEARYRAILAAQLQSA